MHGAIRRDSFAKSPRQAERCVAIAKWVDEGKGRNQSETLDTVEEGAHYVGEVRLDRRKDADVGGQVAESFDLTAEVLDPVVILLDEQERERRCPPGGDATMIE